MDFAPIFLAVTAIFNTIILLLVMVTIKKAQRSPTDAPSTVGMPPRANRKTADKPSGGRYKPIVIDDEQAFFLEQEERSQRKPRF